MKMNNPEEYIIIYDDEDKDDDVIYEECVYFTGVWKSSIYSRPLEILEPQWDNNK